jgi:hypothetical protein
VDRNGRPGPYNNFFRYAIGGTPNLLGLNTAPQNIYYGQNDVFTNTLVNSSLFQNGPEALPRINSNISAGKTYGDFKASLNASPWYQPINDIIGFGSHGLIDFEVPQRQVLGTNLGGFHVGGEYNASYTGSWTGSWTTSNAGASINVKGINPTTINSNNRTPFPTAWRYIQGSPSLQGNIESGATRLQNPVSFANWNWRNPVESIDFQSPFVIAPFSVPFKPENEAAPFGENGPFRAIYQHYDFEYKQ